MAEENVASQAATSGSNEEPDLWELSPEFIEDVRRSREPSENTMLAYERDMQHVLRALAGRAVTAPPALWSTERLSRLVNDMAAGGYSPRSIERMLCTWRQFSQFLLRRGVIDRNPLKRVIGPAITVNLPLMLPKEKVLGAIEQLDLNDERACRDRLMLELICGCGLRVSEVAELAVSDFGGDTLRVRGGIAPREVPVPERVRICLEAYLALTGRTFASGESRLFASSNRALITHRTIQRIVELHIADLAPDRRLSARHLRQAFVFWMLQRGDTPEEVSRIAGHLRLASTQRYAEQLAATSKTFGMKGSSTSSANPAPNSD